jgi:hypothetical protein
MPLQAAVTGDTRPVSALTTWLPQPCRPRGAYENNRVVSGNGVRIRCHNVTAPVIECPNPYREAGPGQCHNVPVGPGAGPFQPNGLASCSRTTPRTGIAVRTATIDPARPARKQPRQCHIAVVLTTAMPHRRGRRRRPAGAVVTGVAPGAGGNLRRRSHVNGHQEIRLGGLVFSGLAATSFPGGVGPGLDPRTVSAAEAVRGLRVIQDAHSSMNAATMQYGRGQAGAGGRAGLAEEDFGFGVALGRD